VAGLLPHETALLRAAAADLRLTCDRRRASCREFVTPDRQPLRAPCGACGAIEIEFAAGARVRITGAVDAATLKAVMAALADGSPR
jgi:transposase